MTISLKKYRFEIVIFFIALFLRFAYLYLSIRSQNGNLLDVISGADGYFSLSQNILQGHGYSIYDHAPYILNSVRPPLFPYFLAATYLLFKSYWTPLLLQLLIGSVLPVFAMALVKYITPIRSVAVGVGIFLAIEPVSVLFSTFFYSETFFTLLFYISKFILHNVQQRYAVQVSDTTMML